MKNPVLFLPRSIWLALMRSNPVLLDNLLVCLPPYILLILTCIMIWFFSKNIGPSDSYLVYEPVGWCARVLLGAFSIWLLAPPFHGRSIPTGVLDYRRRLIAAAVLLASSWLCLAVPVAVEGLGDIRLQGRTGIESVRALLKLYLPCKALSFNDFPDETGNNDLILFSHFESFFQRQIVHRLKSGEMLVGRSIRLCWRPPGAELGSANARFCFYRFAF